MYSNFQVSHFYHGVTLFHMPTTRARYAITETQDISDALRLAAQQWPEDRAHPARLLRRLIHEGQAAIAPKVSERRAQRLRALEEIGDRFRGMYEPGHLDALRAEWPE